MWMSNLRRNWEVYPEYCTMSVKDHAKEAERKALWELNRDIEFSGKLAGTIRSVTLNDGLRGYVECDIMEINQTEVLT